MGKVLRVLVILLAILSIVATVFAYMNYNKREILIGRAHLLEDMFVKVAATFEAEDIPETPQPSYPQRDISAVTSREIENPERSAFWDSYNHKYEPAATPPPMLNISDNQLSYVTDVDAGHGLLKCGSAIVPFEDRFPRDTRLYKLMTTKLSDLTTA